MVGAFCAVFDRIMADSNEIDAQGTKKEESTYKEYYFLSLANFKGGERPDYFTSFFLIICKAGFIIRTGMYPTQGVNPKVATPDFLHLHKGVYQKQNTIYQHKRKY
ncbi:MAG: hypothetical protein N4A71_13915 [Carboxylicivirga sp.]|nr:hypothetical protein [Carboxylicivirga sp.]MCT4647896.1 hypothetical protein [Carboxylicivirga sp.]